MFELADTSPTLEASVGSGEPLLGLKLGKRTYIEDVSAGSNAKNLSYQSTPGPSPISAKRSKPNCQGTCVPHCQVEGCNLYLSSAKDYHQKHRICESHSKSPKVIVRGLELRFCQQCSKFHGLSEFDEKKRSCCRRLSDHNARRRKPQTKPFHFNAARLLSSLNGVEESTVTSDMATTQDLHRALSLFCQMIPGFLVSQNTVRLPTPCMSILPPAFQPAMNAIPQGFLSTLSETWLMEHQTAESQVHNRDSDSHFRVSQLLKAPYDNGFYSDQMNRLC